MLRPKLKTFELGVRKGLLIKKTPREKMGDLNGTLYPSYWPRLMVFKGLEGIVLTRQVVIGDLGTWTFMVTGFNTGSSWTTVSWCLKGFQCSSWIMSWSFG